MVCHPRDDNGDGNMGPTSQELYIDGIYASLDPSMYHMRSLSDSSRI